MGLVGKAANAQSLRRGVGAAEHGGRPGADPAVFVAVVPFQFVPSVAQAGGVAGEGEIDHVGAGARIEFGAHGGGQPAAALLHAQPHIDKPAQQRCTYLFAPPSTLPETRLSPLIHWSSPLGPTYSPGDEEGELMADSRGGRCTETQE